MSAVSANILDFFLCLHVLGILNYISVLLAAVLFCINNDLDCQFTICLQSI